MDAVLLVDLLLLGVAVLLAWGLWSGYLHPGRSGDDGPGGSDNGPVDEEGRSPSDHAAWLGEARRLTREVQTVATTDGVVDDRDRLASQLVPLAAELEGHARRAPPAVDAELVDALFALGSACNELGMGTSFSAEARTGVFLEDRLDRLAADAAALEDRLGADR